MGVVAMKYEPKLPYQYIESYEPRIYPEIKSSRENHIVNKVDTMDELFDRIQLHDGMHDILSSSFAQWRCGDESDHG
jgi:hypothetical protein